MLISLLKNRKNVVGTCEYTSWCSSRKGTAVAGHCHGSKEAQCCIHPSCKSNGVFGYCEITNAICPGGLSFRYATFLCLYAIVAS
jgi:hypothetical protein